MLTLFALYSLIAVVSYWLKYLAIYSTSDLNTCLSSHLEVEQEACAYKHRVSVHALLANVQVLSCLCTAPCIAPVLKRLLY